MSEISKKLSKPLNKAKEQAEDNIKHHPLPYVVGTLAGGVALGCLVARINKK